MAHLTDRANELNLDTRVLEALAIFGTDSDSSLHRLAIHVQRHLLAAVLVLLDIDHCPVIGILKHDVDVDRGREREERHGGVGCRQLAASCPTGRVGSWRVPVALPKHYTTATTGHRG
jgi:hypothetical protein